MAISILWRLLVGGTGLAIFTSKSALTAFAGLLIIVALFRVNWKEFRTLPSAVLMLSLYPLALILNIFSVAGLEGVLSETASWVLPLMAVPAVFIFSRSEDHKLLLKTGAVSLLVGSLFSYYLFFRDFGGVFTLGIRVPSFWDVGRWATFSSLAIFGILSLLLLKPLTWSLRVPLIGLMILSCGSLVLSGSRAPWLALCVACVLLLVMLPKTVKYLLPSLLVVVAGMSMSSGIRDRFASVWSVQISPEGIESQDPSNDGRLRIWRVGWHAFQEAPWFGAGFHNSEVLVRRAVQNHPELEAVTQSSEFSFSDQHSSYLSVLVQMGVIYGIYFFFVIGYCIWGFLVIWWQSRSSMAAVFFILSVMHLFIFIFYSSVESYEMLALFPFLAVMSQLKKQTQEIS